MPEGHHHAGAAEIASEKAAAEVVVVVVAAEAAAEAAAMTMATEDVPRGLTSKNHFYASLETPCCAFRVVIECARGMPRGSDYWRDQEKGYDFPRRHGGGRDK